MKFKVNNKDVSININTYDRVAGNTKGIFKTTVYDDIDEIDYTSNTLEDNNILVEEKLNKVKQLALSDSQINTSGKFDEFTDFQNVIFADACLLELLWDNDEENINGKTIGQLYVESLNGKIDENIEYDKVVFNGNDWLNMASSDNRDEYRSLVLGKFVRYGFSDIKIKEKISGENGFDVFIMEDVDGNIMVYYPCTNLVEINDYLYDSYNIMTTVSQKGQFIGKVTKASTIYYSQQQQAKDVLEECIKNNSSGVKINLFGFSLGGSLAEVAYLNSYKNHSDELGKIVLFNPYHNNLSEEQTKILKDSGNLNLYVCEGDMVSSLFNYDELSNVTKPIYISYEKGVNQTIKDIDNDKSLLNSTINYIKNNYCDSFISSCENIKDKCLSIDFVSKSVLNFACNQAKGIKGVNINAVDGLKALNNVINYASSTLQKFGINIEQEYDFSFMENLHYFEYILTSSHLPDGAEAYKTISFDQNGNVLSSINVNGSSYDVTFPSFGDVSNQVFGSNIYEGFSDMISNIEDKK